MPQPLKNNSLDTDASLPHGSGGKSSVVGALNFMKQEIWEPIEFVFGLYLVSNKGRVRSLPHSVYGEGKNKWQTRKGKILTPEKLINGYHRFTLSYDGKSKRMSAHRLVATTFIPNSENKPQINHRNGIKTDNRVENLEWCTGSENVKHAYTNNFFTIQKGEDSSSSKITKRQAIEIFKSKGSSGLVAKKYPISPKTVRDIRCGKSWSSVTGKKYNPKKRIK